MTSIEEVPQDLLLAITHANRILYWQENLDQNEMPPTWMQPYDEPLTEWFDRIAEESKARYGAPSGEDGDDGTMVGNEYSPGR